MATTKLNSTPQLIAALNLMHSASIVERRMTRQLVHGLALPELLLLLYLRQSPEGQLRRTDLAERMSMSQSSITRLLGPLERRKIASRLPDPHDARAIIACLTDEGRQLVDDALASAELAADDIFSTCAESETVAADEYLRKLVAGVPGGFRAAQR
jgi:DNA-binding MarR family transcriptional regulator